MSLQRVLLHCALVSTLVWTIQGQQKSPGAESQIVLPAGTKITVTFSHNVHQLPQTYDAKVTWPVRIGFTTAIPVGTKAKVFVDTHYYDSGAVDVAQLRTLLIGEKTCDVQTDALELHPGSFTELKFTLTAELKLPR